MARTRPLPIQHSTFTTAITAQPSHLLPQHAASTNPRHARHTPELRNARPLGRKLARTTPARIFDEHELEVAVLKDVDLVGATSIGLVAARGGRRYEDLRPLKPRLPNQLRAVHDQVWVRRAVKGPIFKEIEKDRPTGTMALVGDRCDVLKRGASGSRHRAHLNSHRGRQSPHLPR